VVERFVTIWMMRNQPISESLVCTVGLADWNQYAMETCLVSVGVHAEASVRKPTDLS
jgi:hypothetical protein